MKNRSSRNELAGITPPFQFSLGRLLAAIGLFAVCLWLLRVARESPENGAAATAVIPLVLGTAVGSLLGRAGVGAIATVVVYGALGWLMIQVENEPLINGGRRGVFERPRLPAVSAPARTDELLNLVGYPVRPPR